MSSASIRFADTHQAKSLTDILQTKLQIPATSPEFDFHNAVNQVLADVGLTAADSGGELTFYGQDPDRAKQLQVWRDGLCRPGCQDRSVGSALEIANWRRTGHSSRRAESSAALLCFLRRQMGNDQRTQPPAVASRQPILRIADLPENTRWASRGYSQRIPRAARDALSISFGLVTAPNPVAMPFCSGAHRN